MSLINQQALAAYLKKRKIDSFTEEITQEVEAELAQLLQTKITEKKNRLRVMRNDQNKEHVPVKALWDETRIATLPEWVRAEIDGAHFVGKSKKVIQVPSGRKYHINNRLNDLSGAEWTFFLNSVIATRYPTSGTESYAHHIRKIHPSPKPPQLMKQIIEFFTKKEEWVLDYFMGVGGTLLGASLSGRRALGIDLSETYIQTYHEAAEALGLEPQSTLQGDAIRRLKEPETIRRMTGGEDFSLILIDPPYGDMLSRPKTGEAVKKNLDTSATPFTDQDEDLGNMAWEDFRSLFRESVRDAMGLLKDRGHVVVFIKDLQPKGKETNLLHADLIHDLNALNDLYYLGTKIWADQSINLYPYGYPFSYVANQVHQYIMIFQKKG